MRKFEQTRAAENERQSRIAAAGFEACQRTLGAARPLQSFPEIRSHLGSLAFTAIAK
jgi:hypothetical protein